VVLTSKFAVYFMFTHFKFCGPECTYTCTGHVCSVPLEMFDLFFVAIIHRVILEIFTEIFGLSGRKFLF
jgi:hypothetical protein